MPQALSSVQQPAWNPRPVADDFSRSAVLSVVQMPSESAASSSAALSFASMHFDLGSAYRDMGLVADSIREWLLSAEHPSFSCESWLMIAQAYVELGDNAGAMAALEWSRLLSPTDEQVARAQAIASSILPSAASSGPVSAPPESMIVAKATPEALRLSSIDLSLESSVDRALDDIFDLS